MGILGRGWRRFKGLVWVESSGPRYHGASDDPRYPSPRELRGNAAAFFDIALHAGATIAVAKTTVSGLGMVILVFAATYAALSFAHTVIVQRVTHATIGKALFGLVVIRGQDGGWPTFADLVRGYFWRGFATAFCFFDDNDLPDYDLHEPARVTVRRRDVRALSPEIRRAPVESFPVAAPDYGIPLAQPYPPATYPAHGPTPAIPPGAHQPHGLQQHPYPPGSHRPNPYPAGTQEYPSQYSPNPATPNSYQPQPGPAYSTNHAPPQGYRPNSNQPPHHFPPHTR
ncbi:hypothetical protein [Nocardia sp. CA-120079]|uniref:hypothetical protein n=1 Tax=Nocardia sp. CA-120079 TaxID=3239974 RepID=UPI003D955540